MKLQKGNRLVLVEHEGLKEIWVFKGVAGDYLGELKKVPQDEAAIYNGKLLSFVEAEAAKENLKVERHHPGAFEII